MAVHVVKKGDSLWAISQRYSIPISILTNTNGLRSDKLMPGLSLYIPGRDFIRAYQIKAGDTLYNIAALYQTTVMSIMMVNPGINPYQLRPGQVISIPSDVKMPLQILGFVVPSSPESILPILNEIGDGLTYIAVTAFSFTDEGYAYADLKDEEVVGRSRELGIIPLLMVRNYRADKFDAPLAGRVFGNRQYRRNLVLSLANMARQRGYGGVSIDIEFIPPGNRNDFNDFLRELKAELGNMILQVNVHAKVQDMPQNPIVGAYDYETIGRIADITAVMTIDYGYPGGPPDPISPYWWTAEVIRYSLTQIPPQKMMIAMALYGYDKSGQNNETKALSVLAAQNQAIAKGSSIKWDIAAQSPFYTYQSGSTRHIVWFEDIRSYIEKIRLIDANRLLGTTLWQLSLPAPQLWTYLKNNTQGRQSLISR
ncbi:LysM peptidoglycan-binding domain-containing protein [Peribacillus sp. SCS-26]|uniref:LysM peptidoglycan-binding domain-containing protein n=1 Tax=Paraperibacillus marinus TaxID=3115295 RepID=UPI0039058F01